jgi:hypothetical protein
MATRINGAPQEGVWFSADVRFATLTVTGGDFQNDVDNEVVNSGLEMVIEAVQTRCTVIGLRVTSATVIELIMDYAQAYDDSAVVTEVEALIDALAGLSSATFSNVGTDFTAG